ncbi:MAG TPA: hypothetical protein V6C99_10655, partial [Oculatellaceae cyanobacterium]
GRIVQHNSLLGEGLGIAAALAVLSGTTLSEIVDTAMPQVQEILQSRHGALKLDGHPTLGAVRMAQSRLLELDEQAISRLREQAAAFSL